MSEEVNTKPKFKLSIPMILLIGLGAIVALFFVFVTVRQNALKNELEAYKADLRAKGIPTTIEEFNEKNRNRLMELGLYPEDCLAEALDEKLKKLSGRIFRRRSDSSKYDIIQINLYKKLRDGKSIVGDPDLKIYYDHYKTLVEDITDDINNRQDIYCENYGLVYLGRYTHTLSIMMHYHLDADPELAAENIISIFKASYMVRNEIRLRRNYDWDGIRALKSLLSSSTVPAKSLEQLKDTISRQIPTHSLQKEYQSHLVYTLRDWEHTIQKESNHYQNRFLRYIMTLGSTKIISKHIKLLHLNDKIAAQLKSNTLVGFDYTLAEEYTELSGDKYGKTARIHSYFRFRAKLLAARGAIDVMLFKAKFNRLPNDTAELEKQMNVTLPNDPFVAAKLIYKKLDNGFIIYSVGPNKKDDGGEYNSKTAKDDAAFKVEFISPVAVP